MKLKRFLALAVSLVMVLSIVPAMTVSAESIGDVITVDGINYEVISENLFTNGDFEEGIDGWQTYNGSTLAPANGTDIAHATDKANSGTGSLKVVTNGGGTSAGSLVGFANLDAEKQAGDKYILTLYFNGGTGVTLSAGLVTQTESVPADAVVEACGGLGNSGTSPISCNVEGLTSGAWNKLSYVLTATDATTAAIIYARWCGGAYFDDASLYKVEQVSAAEAIGDTIDVDGIEYTINSANLITNGSFEDAEGNFDTTGWLSQSTSENIPNPQTAGDDHWSAGSVYNYYYMGSEYALGAQYDRWGTKYTGPRRGNPTDGNWYLMSQWADPFGGLCCIKRSFSLESGKTYALMYDIKSNSGNKTAGTVYVGTTLAAGAGTAAGAITESWKTVTTVVEATDSVTELWFNAYNLGNGICFDNFRLYEVEVPQTVVDVTITYTLNGETVKTETKSYDSSVDTGVAFDAVYSYANGTNTIYVAEAATYSETQTVELTAAINNGTYAVGDTLAASGKMYEVKSANLVPNGDFSLGRLGWYNSAGGEAGTDFVTNATAGTITTPNNTGVAGASSLWRAWATEVGKTYLFTFDSSAVTGYFSVSEKSDLSGTADGTVIGSATVAGTNTIIYPATQPYVQINFRWIEGKTMGNFGLYEVAESEVQVAEEIASVAEIADIAVFGNEAVVLPATVKVTGTLGSNVDAAIVWDAPATYPAGATTVNGKATVQFGDQEAEEVDVTVNVKVVDEFTLEDTESFGKQPGNVVYLPMAIGTEFTMEFDYAINEIADASVQMGYNGTIFGNAAFGISPNGGVLKVTGGNKAGTSDGGTTLVESVKVGDVYHMALTMDASDDTFTLVVELADGTIVTTGEKGFRTAQDAINTMTVIKNGNNLDDKGTLVISNIKATADPVELCTVTVDGTAKQVIKGRSYKKALTGAALVDAEGNIYAPVDGVVTVPVNGDMVLTTKALGLEMISGAQVRIGSTELEDGAKLDALADSGLRFLATADYTDTLLADADAFGIKVTAEGSDNVVYVPAEKFQDAEETVFSAAITNLAESNYNRKYTAVAYAKIGDVEITTGEVTRSIYQVSAGIMKNGAADAENEEYTVSGVVKNILNAYVNQTGIRLSVSADGVAVEEGKYTGDVFFTVESVSDGDDGWNVTITPDSSWGTPAEIAEWWTDYVRFNNNNSVAKGYISGAAVEDGVLTFNFDTTADAE